VYGIIELVKKRKEKKREEKKRKEKKSKEKGLS
jgi:hypothetical protein